MMDACEKGKQERKLEILVRKGFLKVKRVLSKRNNVVLAYTLSLLSLADSDSSNRSFGAYVHGRSGRARNSHGRHDPGRIARKIAARLLPQFHWRYTFNFKSERAPRHLWIRCKNYLSNKSLLIIRVKWTI